MTLAEPKPSMTVDEFLVWAEGRPGRYELVEGQVVTMASEMARHARAKAAAYVALTQAVRSAGLACEVFPDGMTVRIAPRTAYEPDALVRCGPRLDGDAIEVPDPVVVVEVLSPSTGAGDTGGKFAGYFGVPSVQHYLILDPVQRLVIHHRRGASVIETAIAIDGRLRLDPPGIEFALDELFSDS